MNAIEIFNSSSNANSSAWIVVNDGVMGGKSQSTFHLDAEGNGIFEGAVSLKNNGGFCSVKMDAKALDLSNSNAFTIRLKGDGKEYQFRVKSKKDDSHSYIYHFQTSGNWEDIEIPIIQLYPSFRGKKLDLPNYDGSNLEEVAFLIGNKQEEKFQLLISKIEAK